MKERIILWLASGLGLGLAPIAPGTFGTLLGVGIYYLIGSISVWIYLLVLASIFVLAVWLSNQAEQILLTRDPQLVTIDEVVGYLITMLSFPVQGKWIFLGFLLFRIFDIAKIYPASYFDRMGKRGLAVVMDDVVAGIYANLSLQVIRLIIS